MRHLRIAGLLALLSAFILSAGLVPQPASAADAVVSGETCTRNDLANAISEASDGSIVTFQCDDPVIKFGPAEQIAIGDGQSVTIDGSNGNGEQIILQGGGDDYHTRFFSITAGGTLTIQHLTMEDGTAGDGGAIHVDGGTLNVMASTFRHNTALSHGGAIHSFRGIITISQSVFVNNEANLGGAIYQNSIVATLTINESRFEGNSADQNGGAVNNNAGSTIIRRSTFVDNEAGTGGAIVSWDDSVDIIASTFIDNISSNNGSAIYVGPNPHSTSLRWSTIIQPENTRPALYLRGSLTLEGVILGGSGSHCAISANGSLSDSYTLSNDDSCDLDGTGSANNVPDLGLFTRTTATINGVEQIYFPLFEGSPAIDAAPAVACDTDLQAGLDTDQLGTQRPVNQLCDIGAIEGLVIVPHSLCADQWNGSLSMARNSDCGRSETLIELPWDPPLSLCVNDWNGAVRASDNCGRSEHPVIVDGNNTINICVNRWNDTIRVSDQCSRSERSDAL